nr:RING-H2 finger protein ATL16 [Tanacetum cinerariifolium]
MEHKYDHESPHASFPIIAVAIIGIFATIFVLVFYYIFVIKCCLNWHRIDILRRFSLSRSRSDNHNYHQHHFTSSELPKGLDESVIRLIPILKFQKKQNDSDNECAVCLAEFQDNEKLRMIPNCAHVFHIDCIDIWLQNNPNCPLCRNSISISIPSHYPVPEHIDIDTSPPALCEDNDYVVIELCSDDVTLNSIDILRRFSLSRSRSDNHNYHQHHFTSSELPKGLDESVIRLIPILKFQKKQNDSDNECAVCLAEFQDNEKLRMIPNCAHVFHIDCIDITACPEPITPLNEGTSNQNTTKSIIEGYVSATKELLKEPSNRDLIKPMLLDFNDIQDINDEEIKVNEKGKAKMGDEDLSKPFKEVLKCPFTRRIVEFLSPGHRMPVNAKIYDGTSDPEDHVGWRFLNKFGMLKACDKDPTKISKIVQRSNETLSNFKERWVSESNAIPNVSELMQISSFMSSHKCPELSKCFSDNIPKTVDEMLKRVDDYLRSEKAAQEHHAPYVPPHRPNHEFRRPKETRAVLTLDSLVSTPQEILAMEHQLHLPQPAPLAKGKRGVAKQRSTERQSNQLGTMPRPEEENHENRQKVDERPNNIPAGAGTRSLGGGFGSRGRDRREKLVETQTTVLWFSDEQVKPLGKIELDQLKAILSTIHGMMKSLTPWGVATLVSQITTIFECRRVEKKQAIELPKEIEPQEKISLVNQVLVNPAYLEQLVVIGKGLSPEGSTQLKNLLKKNKDIFAWEPADMTRVPKRIIKHSLNANPSVTPVSQKRRVFCSEKSRVITKEVTEWLKAGIVRPMKYPTWISNPFLVKKVDERWRMCIDFKNINVVCPKDYYPLTEIDSKIESVMGFSLKKGRKRFPRTQKDDPGPTGPYNFTPEGNFVHIPGGIERSSQCNTADGKERKAISGTLYTSGKLAQYSVEPRIYNITYKPRNAIKGQILADFIKEVPVGSETMVPRHTQYTVDRQKDCKEECVLYTDGVSSIKVETLDVPSIDVEKINAIVEEEGETWMNPIINCLERGVWLEDQNKARALRMKIGQYVTEEGVLFKKSYLMPMLWCVGSLQANYVIREIHMRACKMHLKARSVVAKAIWQGYCWPTMHQDAREEIHKCNSCQIYSLIPKLPKH